MELERELVKSLSHRASDGDDHSLRKLKRRRHKLSLILPRTVYDPTSLHLYEQFDSITQAIISRQTSSRKKAIEEVRKKLLQSHGSYEAKVRSRPDLPQDFIASLVFASGSAFQARLAKRLFSNEQIGKANEEALQHLIYLSDYEAESVEGPLAGPIVEANTTIDTGLHCMYCYVNKSLNSHQRHRHWPSESKLRAHLRKVHPHITRKNESSCPFQGCKTALTVSHAVLIHGFLI